MRLSFIGRIMEIEEGVIRGLHQIMRKPNSINCFIIHLKKFLVLKQAMLTSRYVKFIFDSACKSVSLGDEGLFSFCKHSPIQIADVICRVVFVFFLLCFQPIVCLFLPRETSEMFCHFYTHSKNNSTSSPGLLG